MTDNEELESVSEALAMAISTFAIASKNRDGMEGLRAFCAKGLEAAHFSQQAKGLLYCMGAMLDRGLDELDRQHQQEH